ncbi:YeeE/YedE family protein [Clostridium sp. CTA-7]
MKKNQIYIGFSLVLITLGFAYFKGQVDSKLALFLITGLMIGYSLQRSRFGFAGGVRKPVMMGNADFVKALLVLFSITVIVTAGIHYASSIKGGEIAFRAAQGASIVPGSQSVKPATLGLFIGGLLFGIGMIAAGCCASGTLTDIGEGAGRAIIVLPFFCIGSVFGVWHLASLEKTFLYEKAITVYLPDHFGYLGSILVSLFLFLLIYIFVNKYESKRKAEGTYREENYADWEKEIEKQKDYKFFSKETYHSFFVKRWSFMTGAIWMAILFIFILVTTNKSWGVTSTFVEWGIWLLSLVGINFTNVEALNGAVKIVNKGLLNDPGSLRNIGIIIGAFICMLLAAKCKFNFRYKLKDIVSYIIAGLMMGYGARLAGGCNAGALLGGISNLSLSGWTFLVAMVIGGLIGIKFVKKCDISI